MKYSILLLALFLTGCLEENQTKKTAKMVQNQQSQYNTAQPVPIYDWSLERDLVIQLYNIRNMKAVTHSVWRSDRGTIEGHCPSIGFGLPYDTSLTNPLVRSTGARGAIALEQAEPNGIYASKNTNATWVMCVGEQGRVDPVYVETKVTVYPYPVTVNYSNNVVKKSGKSSISISVGK